MPKSSSRAYLLWATSLLAVTVLFTLIYLPWTHTLAAGNRWESTKVDLERGVMGGVAFLITPLGLQGNRLNLGAWHGFQEVFLKDPVSPEMIQFEAEVPKEGYFSFLYNKKEDGYSGIRFSRNELYPSLYFRADTQGRFLEQQVLPPLPLKDSINRISMVFQKKGLLGFLNGQPIGSFEEDRPPSQRIGFRGSSQKVYLDNLFIKSRDTSKVTLQDFSPSPRIGIPLLWIGGTLGVINLILFWWGKNKFTAGGKRLYPALTFNLVLLFLGIPFYFLTPHFLIPNYHIAKLQFKLMTRLGNYESNIELKPQALDRLRRDNPFHAPHPSPRLLFIGTSQTWGAGARIEADTFVARLEKELNGAGKKNQPIQLINAGISGERSYRLLEDYRREWIKWNPRGIILNLSNNDQDSEKFRLAMEEFLKFNKEREIPTLLVLEPNSPEQIRENLPPNHEILKDLGNKYQIHIVDLQACLSEKSDTGFLWWDFVHLTSWGHEVAAGCLLEPIQKLLSQT